MKKVIWSLLLVVFVCSSWFCGVFVWGMSVGRTEGARQMARHIYNPAFRTDGFDALISEESNPKVKTSEYQWSGDIDSLAKLICQEEGIEFNTDVPTMGYLLSCPKC